MKRSTVLLALLLCLCFKPVYSQTAATPTPSQSPTPAAEAGAAADGNFFQRRGKAYTDDWNPPPADENAPAPETTVGYPAPVSSPPFPFAYWPYGGSPTIGAPDANTYPLMQAIDGNKSRTKFYGWFDPSFTLGTSNAGKFANAPEAYNVIPNSIQLDQAVLYIERLPNEVQHDHFDYGFRLASLYGLDYRFTTAKGFLSQQLLAKNNTYGYDLVMYYADLWFPHVAQGLNVRIGRYISLPDIEAQLAPNNYTYTHSITYTYDCYTQTGIVGTLKLNKHFTVQGAFSASCEAQPWVADATPTGTACVSYTFSDGGGNNLYLCANAINNAKYAYNNLNGYYLTWYHKIGKSQWHTATEGYYQYEKQVPNVAGNVANPSTPELGANGALCQAGQQQCYAPSAALLNYTERDFNHHHDSLNIRNEIVDDVRGQRTGYKTIYSEHTIGLNHWIGSTVTFRPELRVEHSYNSRSYDLGTKTSQFTVSGDLVYHF